ncbi:cytochrome P450 [Lentinus tigrinus ALCF2SS1-6]|uniref:Cytochrome P450 n=1 Tax=Lentinus tigrinus ALCF2SS1-6 TaxID=1328759 RepID=A0A5C2SNQ2_9APHY|nr:cytochrome P450 [Lentinus tigrinus ALCF2SS1-6]
MNSIVLLLAVIVVTLLFIRFRRRQFILPPGPKPITLVGNVLDLTSRELWLRASEWARCYGDIVYLHVFGQGLLFLNTYEVAIDLLERKGSIYSDKPRLVMAGELCGCENMVAFTRYGDKARRQRRLMVKALGPNAIPNYHTLLEVETQQLLKRLADDPKNYETHVRRYAGTLTLLVVYGYRVTSNDDLFVNLAEECVDILSNRIASGGGIWPVDVFPFLRYLPLWFPGAGFKRKAIQWKARMQEFTDKPYELVKSRMREGTATPCFCTTLLEEMSEKHEKFAEQDFDLRWTANSMYSASLDTTVTVVLHFFLMMLQHPEVAKKAQKEIETVVGADRFPTFADRVSLPYVDAVMSEVLRWGTPVPLGLPHRLMEDDIYNDMHIPRGTLVFGNVWNMTRNPDVFPNPDAFHPERYMEKVDDATAHRRDPRNVIFGFGRRRCPGSHLIESSLWIVITSFLATFDIKKAVDEHGEIIEPAVVFENAVFRTPNTFPCDIQPRSARAMALIREQSASI